MVKQWPKVTFFIIGNEFCERFSFYGMRAVLTLYAINVLRFSSAKVIYIYHGFIALSYGTPILGSILADGYIGKFWTILLISMVYILGQLILTISSAFDFSVSLHPTLDILGLALIGIGTGGIKPCVAAFGADQFNPNHTKMVSAFFAVFYFSLNAGSAASMFITPELRAIRCGGHESCFPLAFGLPAALMLTATILFVLGSPKYKNLPLQENAIFRVAEMIYVALKNKSCSKIKREHWLEHYLDQHRCETDRACKALLQSGQSKQCAQTKFLGYVTNLCRVINMLLPLVVFWALYDQQGSKWTMQALAMDGNITDSFMILPDQMGLLNSFIVLLSIPLFQFVVYPLIEKFGIKTTPLRRMAAGGFLTSAAFVICAVLQFQIEETLPIIPTSDTAYVSFINVYKNCSVTVTDFDGLEKKIGPDKSLVDDVTNRNLELFRVKVGQAADSEFLIKFDINLLIPCSNVSPVAVQYGCLSASSSEAYAGGIALCRVQNDNSSACNFDTNWESVYWSSSTAQRKDVVTDKMSPNFTSTVYSYKDIRAGRYHIHYIPNNVSSTLPDLLNESAVHLKGVVVEIQGMGGVYSLTITSDEEKTSGDNLTTSATMHTIIFKNHLSILWQIPQYAVITFAEVLIIMTGIEFAYSQAAPVLKSVVQAVWLSNVACGDMLIIIIESLHLFENLVTEMLVYAVIMFLVAIAFSLMAFFYYEYAHYNTEDVQHVELKNLRSD
ncbi:unnamed protein product [Enterobius vermicularis]|uniref:Oligopeptide transporter 1 n=1 Tax=Enterobius vermicularis TaxID=51028 RepID=A0A0N4V247_ENTVE|nr:unnamed protein product [Enterobius vermicularis]